MTTFGGHTIPPIFTGAGGGFAQGDIRIGSVGATEVGPTDGQAQHTIPSTTANVGDDLWVVTSANGILGNEVSGNWTGRVTGTGGLQRIWSRVATGTAADDFIMPASTLFVVAKMWSLQNFLPFDDFPALQFQGGLLNTGFQIPWNVGFPPGVSLANTLTQDPRAFVYLFAFQFARYQPLIPSPSITNLPITPMETIMDEVHFAPTTSGVDTLYTLVQFRYTNPSIAYDEYSIGYTPAIQASGQWVQHQRYRLT